MNQLKRASFSRVFPTVLILSFGLVMIPFIEMSATSIGWELFAGVYTPVLDVTATTGAPGSIFLFTGSNYPPNSQATIYINGSRVGTVITDGSGAASFFINSTGADPGSYGVTMEVNINISATRTIDLTSSDPVVTPPPGSEGSAFFINRVLFLPIIQIQ